MSQDLLIITPLTTMEDWSLDINIVDGRAAEVPGDEANVSRQRVALAAYISRGTIPGQEEVGADWPGFLSNKTSLLECDNQVKANMEQFANASKLADSPYPIYEKDESGIKVSLISLKAPSIIGVNA